MKKFISVLLILMLFVFCLAGCGGTNSSDEDTPEETAEETVEETTDDGSDGDAVKARVEMDEYQIHLDAPEDTTLTGSINHSFGQDIVALNEEGEEIARMTLEGADGDEEWFKIVIPKDALHDGHNPTRVKGAELSGKVLETNTKMVSINVGDAE